MSLQAGDMFVLREVETGAEVWRHPFTEDEARTGNVDVPVALLRVGVRYESRVELAAHPIPSAWSAAFSFTRDYGG